MSGQEAADWGDFDDRVPDVSSVDPLLAWFEAAATYPLLDHAQEVSLARAIEAGEQAVAELDRGNPLDPAVEERLHRIAERGARARANFISANLRLVASIAKRYRGHGVDYLDLLQEGVLGLIRAVEKFEWRLGYKFSTYATWWIRQTAQRAVDNMSRTIRIPVHILERIRKLKREAYKLEVKLGREPTLIELADVVGFDPAEIAYLKDLELDVVSLDRPVGDEESSILDFVEDPRADVVDEVHLNLVIESVTRALDSLPERERHVLIKRHGLDDGTPDTLDEIGQEMGLTRERIRQLETVALKKLRSMPSVAPLQELL